MASPMPVPLPFSFVVKNGSKIFSIASGPIPRPVSLIDNSIKISSASIFLSCNSKGTESANWRLTFKTPPFSSMAWKALVHKFINIWYNWVGSALMTPQSCEMFSWISMVVGIDERTIFMACLIIGWSFSGVFSTCAWRLKARICLTRSLARYPACRTWFKLCENCESGDESSLAISV